MWSDHPLWPDACLIDLYCHPDFWGGATELVKALELPARHACLAYGDAGLHGKGTALSAAGFRCSATLKRRLRRIRSSELKYVVCKQHSRPYVRWMR